MSPDALKGAMVATGLFTALAVVMAFRERPAQPNIQPPVAVTSTPIGNMNVITNTNQSPQVAQKAKPRLKPRAKSRRVYPLTEYPIYNDRGGMAMAKPEATGLPIYNSR